MVILDIIRKVYIALVYSSLAANLFGLFLVLRPKSDYNDPSENKMLYLNSARSALGIVLLLYVIYITAFTYSIWELSIFYNASYVIAMFMEPAYL